MWAWSTEGAILLPTQRYHQKLAAPAAAAPVAVPAVAQPQQQLCSFVPGLS